MKKYIYWAFCLPLLYGSCNEETVGQYPIDSVPPGPVTNVQVKEAFGGGAVISYTIPEDLDLLGVKASYTLDTGEQVEVIASAYNSEISVEGFAEVKEHPVTLRAIDKSRNESKPVTIQITPKRAPIFEVMESLQIFNDFGGIQLQWQNPDQKDIIIIVSKPVPDSQLTESVQNIYSSAQDGIGYVRGFPAEPQTFIVEVQDKWGNKTESKSQDCLPLYEEKVNSQKYWKRWNPADIPYDQYPGNYGIEKIWDGKNMLSGSTNIYSSNRGVSMPFRITFDMQQVYKLSRLKLYQRTGSSYLYNQQSPKHFKIYGSLNRNVTLDATEPDRQWIELGEFESIKPSGLPLGKYSQEDLDWAGGGEEFTFPIQLATPVRYIMLEFIENWGGVEGTAFSELEFWGSPEDNPAEN